ncbi:related to PMU1-high copy suppressor of ts tps2 mutant phenotype [Fusarium fujikuroi]|uniref:Related to PMU1-high copy suppressor of ts tps2 mutant phenotype n=1 Tax=Gibberella fujikuroi (strain CBS 195.34 / IMI 58289 / NRRL A-6831) TaxID=1279085 RepID=S0E9X7_GIBF5|nr:related to PMU1-high copy suppressor of ts tps2 mutant phenotype [Fusarium fujikuroi IMI 58289]KLO87088.1 PMU1-high copy suppressor of ts tps2 mutant phenotype [Fusarium fujikuroi]KLP11859.1 PMU1-high copy suppressor of ts tps2 mutant phenotype [Fusarium fujikuroi]KLP21406.1 PMU1-high copy suppressor of ts tps2 mutant phenotype [Fusarium fujikuroi]CCT69293.1 related to PMU1-high copy suppressor of ts tps2 mutant phenotype [Fusarium fujikuroi IMI 58289]SCN80138.1 related to PMU1-high copy su
MSSKWTFKAQPGIFVELADIAHEYPGEKVTTQPNLGLIPDQKYPSDDPDAPDQRDWARLAAYVRWLNENSSDNVSYKVLYLTRHGLGVHNKMHAQVGSEAWNTRVSFQNGDGEETWFDAFLTKVGEKQAHDLNSFWTDLIEKQGAPQPKIFYTSPLARCLQTTDIVFSPLMTSQSPPQQPIVKELLRERITRHTCDYRRDRTWIAQNYPSYKIEDGFEEEDQFTNRVEPETDEEHVVRKQRALEDIFNETAKDDDFVSLTVHSYAIRAIQAAVGSGVCRTREGTSIAIFVRGEKDGEADGPELHMNDYGSADPAGVSSLRRFSM